MEEETKGGTHGEESREGRTRVEERGRRSAGRREGGKKGKTFLEGALSLSEKDTESQLERREEDRRENSALNCQRSLRTEIGPTTVNKLVNSEHL